jgi:omega-hydroxy-beta-dihydromenaquinone-9 sulfotransferase
VQSHASAIMMAISTQNDWEVKMTDIRQKLMVWAEKQYLDFHLPPLLEYPGMKIESWLYDRQAQSTSINKPVFIVGCHRSGTTILYETLAQHSDLAYFTNASSFMPHIPILANQMFRLLGEMKNPVERFVQDGLNISPHTPSEGIRIWELHGLASGNYCLNETHDNPELKSYLKLTIQKHLMYSGRSRFINKNPDNSVRIRYLNRLFPDAYFIHIVRDGRAVCHSLLKFRKLASEFFGAEHRHATSGVKVKAWDEISKCWHSDPVRSVGLVWRAVMETLEFDRQFIPPERYLEVRYEDFVAQPMEYLQKITQFCDLHWDDEIQSRFQESTAQVGLSGRNEAWKNAFSPEDCDRLMAVIGEKMQAYGYCDS